MLEKLFTNEVAVHYNWTGKYNKLPLKELTCIKIIPGKLIAPASLRFCIQ